MKALYDMFPLAVFLIAMVVWDLKVATAAIVVATIVQNALFWLRHRRFERMHLITMFAVLALGGLTLLLDDIRFIKWKPTVVNWVFAILMIGTQLFTSKPALERVMGSQLKMPRHAWNKLNMSWAIFFVVIGLINLYVAFVFGTAADPLSSLYGGVIDDADTRDRYWGYFKVVGMLGLTFIFAIGSIMSVSKYVELEPEAGEDSK